MFRKFLPVVLLVLPFLAVCYLIANAFGYYDPINGCYINIDNDILKGNKDTIHKAIDKIKENKPSDYKVLCKNVNKIVETYCAYFEGETNRLNYYDKESCYVNGSKIIYLRPEEGDSESIIKTRSQGIIDAANKSRIFWNN